MQTGIQEITGEELERLLGKSYTVDEFREVLIAARNGASLAISDAVLDDNTAPDEVEQIRRVWHASEAALAVLFPKKYVPKREALVDMARIVSRNAR